MSKEAEASWDRWIKAANREKEKRQKNQKKKKLLKQMLRRKLILFQMDTMKATNIKSFARKEQKNIINLKR